MENTHEQISENEELSLPITVEDRLPAFAVEQARAVQEVQGKMVIAKKFPRDETAVHVRLMKACERLALAEQAVYRLPISGKVQEGPSIRLAEVAARSWGNCDFGIREISRSSTRTVCLVFCWDLETNTRSEVEITVDHWIEVGKKGEIKRKKPITDPVEIDRLIANRAARKLRNVILDIIPGDFIEDAIKQCRKTVAAGGGVPLADRVRAMVAKFSDVGVNQEMLEEKLKHQIDLTTGEEIVDLIAIYKAIVDKAAKRGEYFNFPEDQEDAEAESVISKIKASAQAAPAAKEPPPPVEKAQAAPVVQEEAANDVPAPAEVSDIVPPPEPEFEMPTTDGMSEPPIEAEFVPPRRTAKPPKETRRGSRV